MYHLDNHHPMLSVTSHHDGHRTRLVLSSPTTLHRQRESRETVVALRRFDPDSCLDNQSLTINETSISTNLDAIAMLVSCTLSSDRPRWRFQKRQALRNGTASLAEHVQVKMPIKISTDLLCSSIRSRRYPIRSKAKTSAYRHLFLPRCAEKLLWSEEGRAP